MSNEKLLKCLADFFSEANTTGFNIFDFIHAEGSPLLALMYSYLFWPTFVEFEGMIFLQDTIEDESDRDRIRAALKKYHGDRQKTEKSFNTVEVALTFGRQDGDTTEAMDEMLVGRLAEMWRCRLDTVFPGRRMKVEVLDPQTTGESWGVVFFQE